MATTGGVIGVERGALAAGADGIGATRPGAGAVETGGGVRLADGGVEFRLRVTALPADEDDGGEL